MKYPRFRSAQAQAQRARMERLSDDVAAVVRPCELPPRDRDWWKDLRKGKRRIYGGLLRAIDVLIAHGHRDVAIRITDHVAEYARRDGAVAALNHAPMHDTGEAA